MSHTLRRFASMSTFAGRETPQFLLAILWGGAFKLDFGLPPVWKIVHFDLYILSTGDVKNMLAPAISSFGWLI